MTELCRGHVRLVRKICQHCAADGTLTPDQVDALGLKVPMERREQLRARWGEGCVECRQTGLFGRIGVFEMLDVGRRVRALVPLALFIVLLGFDASALGLGRGRRESRATERFRRRRTIQSLTN